MGFGGCSYQLPMQLRKRLAADSDFDKTRSDLRPIDAFLPFLQPAVRELVGSLVVCMDRQELVSEAP